MKRKMNEKARNEIRKLQDNLIAALLKTGHEDKDVVIWEPRGEITIYDLKQKIYPEYIDRFREYLES